MRGECPQPEDNYHDQYYPDDYSILSVIILIILVEEQATTNLCSRSIKEALHNQKRVFIDVFSYLLKIDFKVKTLQCIE